MAIGAALILGSLWCARAAGLGRLFSHGLSSSKIGAGRQRNELTAAAGKGPELEVGGVAECWSRAAARASVSSLMSNCPSHGATLVKGIENEPEEAPAGKKAILEGLGSLKNGRPGVLFLKVSCCSPGRFFFPYPFPWPPVVPGRAGSRTGGARNYRFSPPNVSGQRAGGENNPRKRATREEVGDGRLAGEEATTDTVPICRQ